MTMKFDAQFSKSTYKGGDVLFRTPRQPRKAALLKALARKGKGATQVRSSATH